MCCCKKKEGPDHQWLYTFHIITITTMLLIPVSITLQPTRATEDADAKVPTETGTGDTTTITFIWTLAQPSA